MTTGSAGAAEPAGAAHAGGAAHATVCAHCGQALDGPDHARCARMLTMEPPRFCTACGRRMKVQVHPRGWSADCVEHGTLTG